MQFALQPLHLLPITQQLRLPVYILARQLGMVVKLLRELLISGLRLTQLFL